MSMVRHTGVVRKGGEVWIGRRSGGVSPPAGAHVLRPYPDGCGSLDGTTPGDLFVCVVASEVPRGHEFYL